MLYIMTEGKITLQNQEKADNSDDLNRIGVYTYEDCKTYAAKFGISDSSLNNTLANKSSRFESRDNMDIICTPLIDLASTSQQLKIIYIYFYYQIDYL